MNASKVTQIIKSSDYKSPKSQVITTSSINPINGIKTYIFDSVGTYIFNNKWVIEELTDTRWSFRIALDSTWQFDSILPSAIQMDISGQNDAFSNNNLDLLLSDKKCKVISDDNNILYI